MVKPAQRKQIVKDLVSAGRHSERTACELIGISRSAYRYQCKQADKDSELEAPLLEKAKQYPHYGYKMLHGLLKNEGRVINVKRTYRLYKKNGLELRTKRCKKRYRVRCVPTTPERVNECWSMDFVHDQLSDGRGFRVLNIVDNFSRECVGQIVDISITGKCVENYLSELIEMRGAKPTRIVCDNGTEFRCKSMFHWSQDQQVQLDFIQPGKPTQNAFVESFNGKFRDGCLNQYCFRSIKEAREIIENWRIDYNEVRPHSALGYQPPSVFAEAIA